MSRDALDVELMIAEEEAIFGLPPFPYPFPVPEWDLESVPFRCAYCLGPGSSCREKLQ